MKKSNREMNPLFEVSPDDAIGMLIADHKRVANLFADFKRITDEDGDDAEKASVMAKICQELSVHAQLEEEIFYPAVREATHDDDQVDEAVVEHAGAKELIAQLQAASPSDDLYDAKVTVLGEQIDHHVEEEEGSMFPKARFSGVDTAELGAAMLARKSEILGGDAPPLTQKPSSRLLEDDDIDDSDEPETVVTKPRSPSKKAAPVSKAKASKMPKKKRR